MSEKPTVYYKGDVQFLESGAAFLPEVINHPHCHGKSGVYTSLVVNRDQDGTSFETQNTHYRQVT